jgi:hypothetical protein
MTKAKEPTMREQLHIYVPAIFGAILVLALWVTLTRAVVARGKSRWRPVLLCLPMFMGCIGYGLFWFGFFSSPGTAVQLHAIRLTAEHFLGPLLPWISAAWLALSAWLLLPLARPSS